MVTRPIFAAGPIFDALGDPTRRAILDLLRDAPLPAGEIAARFPISRPAVARHVRVLKAAGLLREQVEGRRRIYSLDAAPLVDIDAWLQPYRAFWAARLTALKQLVELQERQTHEPG